MPEKKTAQRTREQFVSSNAMTVSVTANGHTMHTPQTDDVATTYAKVKEMAAAGKANAAEGGFGYAPGNYTATVNGPGPVIELSNGASFVALIEVVDLYNEDTSEAVPGNPKVMVALSNGIEPAKGEIVNILATKGKTQTYAKATSIYSE